MVFKRFAAVTLYASLVMGCNAEQPQYVNKAERASAAGQTSPDIMPTAQASVKIDDDAEYHLDSSVITMPRFYKQKATIRMNELQLMLLFRKADISDVLDDYRKFEQRCKRQRCTAMDYGEAKSYLNDAIRYQKDMLFRK